MNFDGEVAQTRHLRVRMFTGGYDSPQLTYFRNGIEILDRLIATNERFDAGKSQQLFSVRVNMKQLTYHVLS
jgi:hypothetical protein